MEDKEGEVCITPSIDCATYISCRLHFIKLLYMDILESLSTCFLDVRIFKHKMLTDGLRYIMHVRRLVQVHMA